ncbi:MAG TPA: GNAT family N-acetyltransferase [Candidatus Polarisedimenticolia bacterium]|nr:GNAT family N-acetyltransferase [Candidatus Polarisedimenticolia bacterium]
MTIQVRFRPLTPARWADLERLFGPRGGCAGCWCMYPRLRHRDYVQGKGALNRRRLRTLVRCGEAHGVIAYVDGEPAAWCSFGPRDSFPTLSRSRVLAPLDDRPVWSIVCFFVARPFRRRGLSVPLLEAVAAQVRRRGASILEGYPHDPRHNALADAFAWNGILSSFARAGFEECARRSPGRPIVRRTLKHGGAPRASGPQRGSRRT